MKSASRKHLGIFAGLVILPLACQREPRREPPRTAFPRTVNTPIRMSMADLHQSGGVPPKWSLTLPAGDPHNGRELFIELGCAACHAVAGETFSATPPPPELGPELTGMGSHHPQAYFVESILNPDAIIVESFGYTGEDGGSTMPAYPDLTAAQLNDVVAYIQSLTDPEATQHANENPFTGRVDLEKGDVPSDATVAPSAPTPPAKAAIFFVQTYAVRDGELGALERWFKQSGAPAFRSFPGLLELETYVDRTRGPESMVTVFGFADLVTLRAFLAERRVAEALQKFDDFSQVVDRQMYESRPVYRAGTLSGE